MTPAIYSIPVTTIDGEAITLERYAGKTLIIVNVASRCGFTGQYAGLEALYRRWRDRGLEILGFPCNQFGGQEPGSEVEIKQFCSRTHNVSFPLFSKVEVNGEGTHPLYRYLKASAPGLLGSESIKWNFTKFLVGPDGAVLSRFAPQTTPEELEQSIIQLHHS